MRVDSEVGTGMTTPNPVYEPSAEHVYVFPVTFAQQRLLFLNQLDPNSTSYSVPWSIRMTGELNPEALESSLNEIVSRHEILRTTFDVVEGQPVQIVATSLQVPLTLVDLSKMRDPEKEAQVAAMREAQTPVDLKAGPLVRTKLLRLGPADHVLLVTTHHIAFDGWSRGILVSELALLYDAFCAGLTSPLQELPLQYADYSVWQRDYLQGENLDKLLKYWKRQLAGAPTTLDLPTDRPRPSVQRFRGAAKSFVFPKTLSEEVARVSRQFGVTPFMTLLAGFQLLLSRYSGQDDVLVGAIIANRNRAEIEGLIGLFANTLPLRTKLDGDPTFRELLERVKDNALGAYAHQDMPFERLVEELRPERSLSYNPLFQVLFSMQNAARRRFELSGLQLQPLGGVVGTTAKFDLSCFLLDGADGFSGRIEYNTDLFDGTTIERMLRHYQVLLKSAFADPDMRISRLPLLDETERNRILIDFNRTDANYPQNLRLHDFVTRQAEKTPDTVALVCGSERMSYRELNARANQLAYYLIQRGAGPEVLVGIHSDRSTNMLVGILGILKSGSAYVPLDPNYPKERIHHILDDSQASLVVTQAAMAGELPEFTGQRICLDSDWPAISQESIANPVVSVKPENLAYVLFTSGSTGRPKGVAIEHRSAATFVHWAQEVFSPKELDGVLLSTSICFDLSVFEMFVPLSAGGKVILCDNALYLPTLAAKNEVTLINTVPSAMAELLRMGGVPDSVKTVNLAGEALPDALVEQIYETTKAERIYNLYGPTEDTTYSTFTLVPRGKPVTIGRPIANSQVYILDARLSPVPIGVPGELYLAGDGLARGYYGRPDLTRERFVTDPFSDEVGARMYRTGDLARFKLDGNIDYLGRMDHQVKLRGFRIELGEIETVLTSHPSIDSAVVVVREDRPGDKKLVAYLVPRPGQNPSPQELRTHLEQSLPGYMVPAAFVKLDALPLTDNGKINRRALPAPATSEIEARSRVTPTDQLELILVKIWQRVLGVSNIGVDDNFFDLGGHSLLAVRLLSEVEKVVGRKIPLASLFRGSTVASLAKLLREGSEADPEPLVVEYQAGNGGLPPIFVVALPGVRSIGYVLLARHLGEDQAFYKLQAQGPLVQGRPLNPQEKSVLAQRYIAGMRAVQPHGPYFLAAMCEGCHIAEQMILQLEAQDQEVAMFAIFDTWVQENIRRRWQSRLFGYQQRLHWFRKASIREQMNWMKRAVGHRIRIWTGRANALQKPWDEAYWPEQFIIPSFRAPVVLFKRPKQPSLFVDDPQLGWGVRSKGGLEIHTINADHHEVLREPHVQLVSKVLLAHLRTASVRPEQPAASGTSAIPAVAISVE